MSFGPDYEFTLCANKKREQNIYGQLFAMINCVLFALHSVLWFLQYKQNPEMFKQTARLWSHVYAGAPVSSPEYTRKIDKLCAMGFDKVST